MTDPDTKRRGKSPKFPETTCRDCACFRERTQTTDEVAWGECWSAPPFMAATVSETGEPDLAPATQIVILPYRCYRDFKPLEH